MSTGLITLDQLNEQFPILVPGSPQQQLMLANLAGDEISIGDLDRLKVPSGGGVMWEIPTISGPEGARSLEGIILHVTRRRAYWKSKQVNGDQPDCSSNDCVTGVGEPGGACAQCPLNKFGTATDDNGNPGRGKACKETTLLFLLRKGETLPQIVSVPPSSLKIVKQYRLKLPVPYFAAITSLTLEKKSNRGGQPYAEVKPTYVGRLPDEAAQSVRQFAEQLGSLFESVSAGDAVNAADGHDDE